MRGYIRLIDQKKSMSQKHLCRQLVRPAGAKRAGKRPSPAAGRRPWLGLALSIAGAMLLGAGFEIWFAHRPAERPQPPSVAILPPKPILPDETLLPTPPPSAHPAEPLPAWLRFAAPSPSLQAGERLRIAIIIDDCGLDRPRTERAMALPAAVTLSFLAYAEDLPRQTAAARRDGHELLVHVPMQPINAHVDMGPNGLAIDQSHDEVLRRLRWDLDRFDGYVGINNHMGSRFTTDPEAMHWVLGELKARGLMFLDSRTIGNSTGEIVAASEALPFAARDVFLDDDQQATAVDARLRDVEAVARKKGTAIAIGHPHDATLAALNTWIAGLSRQGIALVPLTEIVKARMPIE
jgi:polysaccharide deacetylase 2 family uncharacterized protein YibQ